MVVVTFRRDSRQRLSSVVASGHAQSGEPGEDVVCAAVSALLQATWVGLTDVARVPVSGRRTSGDFTLRWPEAERERIDVGAIVATAEIAVEQIAKQNPHFIRFAREVEP